MHNLRRTLVDKNQKLERKKIKLSNLVSNSHKKMEKKMLPNCKIAVKKFNPNYCSFNGLGLIFYVNITFVKNI